MKFIYFMILLGTGYIMAGCSHSKDNVSDVSEKNIELKNQNISLTKENIVACNIKGSKNDFCSKQNINIYNSNLNKKINFSNDKILISIKSDQHNEKGTPRKTVSFVVIDPIEYKIYPFYQTIGNFVNDRLEEDPSSPPIIDFNKSSNMLCLSGTTFFDYDNNINVENECYIFSPKEKNYFKKIQK